MRISHEHLLTLVAALALMAVSAMACTPANQPSPTSSPAGSTPGPTARPVASPGQTPTPPAPSVEVFVKGLAVPWAMDFAPDGRIFVTERAGRIRIVKNGELQPEPWLAIQVAAVSEAGLLGMALDPAFARNGFVYTAYTYRASDGRLLNRLVRLREDLSSGKGAVDKVLFDNVPGGNNHDGGRVRFGPDGRLYWTMGERGDASLAQDLASPNGKILRLNADGSIPADNPFRDSPVYSYGHRNPQGLAWQPGTGRLYATEHGPSGERGCCRDEINLIEPGKNYGWPIITGDEGREGLVQPLLQSGVNVTWAPGGATFVRQGPWAGSLLFAGLRGETLYRLILDPGDPRKVQKLETYLVRQFGRLRDVVEGPDGAIYVLTSNLDGRGRPPPDGDKILRLPAGYLTPD